MYSNYNIRLYKILIILKKIKSILFNNLNKDNIIYFILLYIHIIIYIYNKPGFIIIFFILNEKNNNII